MKYRYIVFDIYGTLIDTEYAVLHSLQDTVQALNGIEIPLEKLNFALGITGSDALKNLGIKDIPFAMNLWDKNMSRYTASVTVFDGITELLENLLRLDYELGIITSKTRREFKHDFCRFSISQYFKTVICADDTKEHKPCAAPFFKYMELSGAGCRQILYVGDSEYDSACAQNAETDFALAVWGSHSSTIKADYYLKEPTDLLTVINQRDA